MLPTEKTNGLPLYLMAPIELPVLGVCRLNPVPMPVAVVCHNKLLSFALTKTRASHSNMEGVRKE
jgi:hypothetical protein